MNLKQYIEFEKKRIDAVLSSNKPAFLGSQASLVRFSRRVFTEGKNPDGSQIGQYSEKGIYINPNGEFKPRNKKGFTNKGKTGKSRFEDGREHVTTYFEGWKGFREAQGLKTEFKNLNYTGDLKSDIENPINNIPTPIQVSEGRYKVSIKRSENIPKYLGNKETLSFSKNELREFYRIADLEFRKLFAQ